LNVAMDPRVMKEWLLTQWLSGLSPMDASATGAFAAGEDSGLFGLLLSQALAGMGGSEDSLQPGLSTGLSASGIAALDSYNFEGGWFGSGSSGIGPTPYDGLIEAAAARYGVDPALIKGVIQTESSFQAGAQSSAGAKGLMQLMDDTARSLGVADPFDPQQNIDAGTRYLSYLLRKYDGNVMTALAAYNAGPGRIDRLGIRTDGELAARIGELPQETQRYVRKVLENSGIGGIGFAEG